MREESPLERIRREWRRNERALSNRPDLVAGLERAKANTPAKYHPLIEAAIGAQMVWTSYHADMGVLLALLEEPAEVVKAVSNPDPV